MLPEHKARAREGEFSASLAGVPRFAAAQPPCLPSSRQWRRTAAAKSPQQYNITTTTVLHPILPHRLSASSSPSKTASPQPPAPHERSTPLRSCDNNRRLTTVRDPAYPPATGSPPSQPWSSFPPATTPVCDCTTSRRQRYRPYSPLPPTPAAPTPALHQQHAAQDAELLRSDANTAKALMKVQTQRKRE